MGVAEERGLPAAEGVIGDRHRDGHVDAHHPDLDVELVLACSAAVTGEDRRAVAERVAVHKTDRVLVGVDARDCEYRSEHLVAVDVHVLGDVVDQGRAEPEAAVVDLEVATIDDDRRSAVGSAADMCRNVVTVLGGDQRTHLSLGPVTRCDDDRRDPLLNRGDQRVGDVSDCHRDRDGHAAFAGRTVRRGDGSVRRRVDVGVRQHNHVVLGAAECLDALSVSSRTFVDAARDRRGPHERDRLDVRVFDQAIHSFSVALHDVEHPWGKSGPIEELGEQQRS